MSAKTVLLFYVLFGTVLGCVGEKSEPPPVGGEETATDTNGTPQFSMEEGVTETAPPKPIDIMTS